MFKFIDQIVKDYEPKQKTVAEVLFNLGATTGYDTSTDQFADQQSLNSIYSNITWAYRSIAFIASNLARIPWIYKKNDEDITDTIVDDIFQNPNPMQTRYDFFLESISRLELQGEMFWELFRGTGAVGRQVLAIFPDWRSEEVTVIPDNKKYVIKGYKRNINGKVVDFDADEVFYLKHFNSLNPIRGMSPLFPARHAAGTDLNATYYTKQFFKQGARPSGMLTTEQKLTEPEQRRLEEYIKKKYQSVNQMHEIMVMWGGLEFTPLNTMNMTDMQFTDLKKMTREEIILAFGLSLEVMGLGQKTFENVQFYRRLAWTETMQPLMDKFLALLNKNLAEELYQIEGITVEADYNNVEALREERSKKVIDFERGFKTGAITPNEMREIVFGLDPISIPEMDSTYLHLNVANPVDLPEIQMPESVPGTEAVSAGFQPLGKKGLSYDDRTKIWYSRVKKYEQYEPSFKTMVNKIFDQIMADVKKRASGLLKGLYANQAIDKAEEEGITIPPSLVIKIKKLYDNKRWEKEFARKGEPVILDTMASVGGQLLQSEGEVFNLVHPEVKKLLGERVKQFSAFVSDTTSDDITRIVIRTLQETADLSIAEQTRAIQKVFDAYHVMAKTSRAATIARTEAMGAANAGTQAALVQGGFLRKMWITSRDDRVRDEHQIDGEVVNVQESFSLGVAFPQAINERCIIIDTLEPVT